MFDLDDINAKFTLPEQEAILFFMKFCYTTRRKKTLLLAPQREAGGLSEIDMLWTGVSCSPPHPDMNENFTREILANSDHASNYFLIVHVSGLPTAVNRLLGTCAQLLIAREISLRNFSL
ncbi:MAG: hypothetical protein ACI83D_000742 [Planctomycetota bacterium]